jgi:hypothetical protein
VGELIHEAIQFRNDDQKIKSIQEKVHQLMAHRPLFSA